MRTTLNIDDELLASARKFTGETEKTKLVRLGLHALIEREAAKRLAKMGASMPNLNTGQTKVTTRPPMILADTSVWIDFFRNGSSRLEQCLSRGQIVTHSVVIGELATGNLAKRSEILDWLGMLPRAVEASARESLLYLESHRLYGRGVGWNDIQLLVSAQLTHVPVWSLDTRLAEISIELRLAYAPR